MPHCWKSHVTAHFFISAMVEMVDIDRISSNVVEHSLGIYENVPVYGGRKSLSDAVCKSRI